MSITSAWAMFQCEFIRTKVTICMYYYERDFLCIWIAKALGVPLSSQYCILEGNNVVFLCYIYMK